MVERVVVTGGAGYLGSVLCETLLAAGYRVTVVDRLFHNQSSLFHLCPNPNFDFVFGDVRDEQLMKRMIGEANVLIPLAAVVGVPGLRPRPLAGDLRQPRRGPHAQSPPLAAPIGRLSQHQQRLRHAVGRSDVYRRYAPGADFALRPHEV